MILIFFKGSRKWTLKETMFSSMWGYWHKGVYLALEGQTLMLWARGLGLKAFGWGPKACSRNLMARNLKLELGLDS